MRQEVKKVCFIGTHSSGKSTAASYLTSQLKRKYHDKSVVCLEENVRRISKFAPLNSTEFTKLAIIDQIKRELEAEIIHNIVVCDRTTIDFLAYQEKPIPEEFEKIAIQNTKTFNYIYFIRPDNNLITDDGFRNLDINYMKEVDYAFECMLQLAHIEYQELKTSQIFNYDYLKDL